MSNSKKKPLSPEDKAECDALNKLFQEKKRGLCLTQEKVASAIKISPGAVSMYLNGTNKLNANVAAAFSKLLGISVMLFSPRLEREIAQLSQVVKPPKTDAVEPVESDKYTFIPVLSAKAAAGTGEENPFVEVKGELSFKRSWLEYKGFDPLKLVVIYASGDSMQPTLNEGDVLLVDTRCKEPEEGKVFALNGHSGTIVKRVRIDEITGRCGLQSDNPKYDIRWLKDDDPDVQIIGRVVWAGGEL